MFAAEIQATPICGSQNKYEGMRGSKQSLSRLFDEKVNSLNRDELIDLVKLMEWNAQLGCYTRQAFDHIVWPVVADKALWVIFFDVDRMKAMNSSGGWDHTSAVVRQSIVVRSSDYVSGQVFSGDEFVVVITANEDRSSSDPMKLCQRILEDLLKQGASATFAFRKVTSSNLEENIEPIKQFVMNAKNSDRRGTITRVK